MPGRGRRVVLLLVALSLLAAAALSGSRRWASGRGTSADSTAVTVLFSHAVHAGKLGIKCLFCHGHAARGAVANFPAARDCFVCHWAVGEGNPEVAKIEEAVASGRPLRWRAVARLPEHVQFEHAPHVRRGIECAACHGAVAGMEHMRQPERLGMDFCVDCHRREGAAIDCVACHR